MKRVISIVLICFMFGQLSCSRKEATTETDSSVAAADNNPESTRLQARALLEHGKQLYIEDSDERAAEEYKKAIQLDPKLAEAHFRLGLAYEALGKQEEAEQAYKKAVEAYKVFLAADKNSEDGEAHYNLGQTYAGLHLYEQAVREYRQATRLKPDDADIFYDLGMALTRLAQYSDAVVAFSKSLELDPENYRAQDALEEAREGVKRIQAGKKHQEELLKKKKEEELEKLQEAASPTPP